MQGPSIEFADVGLTLGNTRILRNVSFSVRAGTVHCIIGANGGGKTSLIRSLLGQMPHTGKITIQWHGGQVIGYVPQTLDFDKTLPVTVRDFLAMTTQRRPVFLGVSRTQLQMIDAALDRVRIKKKGAYRLGSLSGATQPSHLARLRLGLLSPRLAACSRASASRATCRGRFCACRLLGSGVGFQLVQRGQLPLLGQIAIRVGVDVVPRWGPQQLRGRRC